MANEPAVWQMKEERAPANRPSAVQVQRLTHGCEKSVLDFLSCRPAHTVFMAGLIHANGLESSLNRGMFYGCHNQLGTLEGVALIGHAVMFETHNTAALNAFAAEAKRCDTTALIRGEREKLTQFWIRCAQTASVVRCTRDERLLELRNPPGPETGVVEELRPATPDELAIVMEINAGMALVECGADPSKTDAAGFRARTLRRVEQGQVWVGVKNGKIVFKADVLATTPQAVYLEGVYVVPAERGRGCGLRCVRQLSRILLRQTSLVCLFVNQDNAAGQALYQKVGFQPAGHYRTIFLQGKSLQANQN